MGQDDILKILLKNKNKSVCVDELENKLGISKRNINKNLSKMLQFEEIKLDKTENRKRYFKINI